MRITDDILYVGVNDHNIDLFEGQYIVPNGMAYNSYVINDEKIAVMDTVDAAFGDEWLKNIADVLNGATPDYLIIQHMEPDHAGTIDELLLRHPETDIVCRARIRAMLPQFRGGVAPQNAFHLVKEGDTFETGHHTLTFLSAPMVHWPEVMVSYDLTTRTLFSADAFGTFGAINGALFADEVDFFRDYVDEARRYYCNIVGKYGTQVQALLKKASTVQIDRICPLHGFVWRKNIGEFIDRYVHWSTYTPEEQGVMIAYASVYGGTENAAELLSGRLRERGAGQKRCEHARQADVPDDVCRRLLGRCPKGEGEHVGQADGGRADDDAEHRRASQQRYCGNHGHCESPVRLQGAPALAA